MVLGIGGLLPSQGLEIPMRMDAINVPLKVLGLVTLLDFKGGITVRVEGPLSEGVGGVRHRVIGFEVSANSPQFGTVTISQSDTETPLSPLQLIKTLPPTFRNILYLDFTVTIERPPGGGVPWVLSNTKPAQLRNDHLKQFPAQGDVYQLQEPVDLTSIGAPDRVVAQLQQFPVTLTHDP